MDICLLRIAGKGNWAEIDLSDTRLDAGERELLADFKRLLASETLVIEKIRIPLDLDWESTEYGNVCVPTNADHRKFIWKVEVHNSRLNWKTLWMCWIFDADIYWRDGSMTRLKDIKSGMHGEYLEAAVEEELIKKGYEG